MGFIPLNMPFKNADAHHLDKKYVIYIPQELHKHHHGNGDLRMNMKAWNFLQTSSY